MNRRSIAAVFYVLGLFALTLSVPAMAFLCLGLFFCPESTAGWITLILFLSGCALLHGYGKIVHGRMALHREGWVWGGSFLLNLAFTAIVLFFPSFDESLCSKLLPQNGSFSVGEIFWSLVGAGLLSWYPVAVFLSAYAFIQWYDRTRKWPAGFLTSTVASHWR